ncbi:unnamed protein product [Darwinula stevensoni]|uniref:Uncharacterized protein n=1 Tax=Darwinula stevensoni TaxID=69355 RepID=A0A7R8X918_9CRUS|nr:unnamed protein product [Darwinula stevensoni]CAG0888562.1 unnamed protein product [Darwinula stevensoni]
MGFGPSTTLEECEWRAEINSLHCVHSAASPGLGGHEEFRARIGRGRPGSYWEEQEAEKARRRISQARAGSSPQSILRGRTGPTAPIGPGNWLWQRIYALMTRLFRKAWKEVRFKG